MTDLRGRRVVLGVTGGIAAYKVAALARGLTQAGAEVHAVLTEAATRFVGPDTFAALTGHAAHTSVWDEPGSVLHVQLAHDADVMVIAPASANTIAKLAHGLADDLLAAVALEFDGPMLLAPAMHAGMWEADATQHNVALLSSRGVRFVGPTDGALAHGDDGPGRMSEPEDILTALGALLERRATPGVHADRALEGRQVLITAGPTHEPIDPVRFLGNRSTGAMGVALAAEALARGADVTLVLGPGSARPPAGVTVVRIETAEDLRTAVAERRDADVVVMAAAVADFRPKAVAPRKLKKQDGPPELVLEPTPDVLAELGSDKRPGQILVGFAAETDDLEAPGDLEAAGRDKLVRKGVDLVVANVVGRPGTGFGATTNDAAILTAAGDDVGRRTWTKDELAAAVWDRVATLLRGPGTR